MTGPAGSKAFRLAHNSVDSRHGPRLPRFILSSLLLPHDTKLQRHDMKLDLDSYDNNLGHRVTTQLDIPTKRLRLLSFRLSKAICGTRYFNQVGLSKGVSLFHFNPFTHQCKQSEGQLRRWTKG